MEPVGVAHSTPSQPKLVSGRPSMARTTSSTRERSAFSTGVRLEGLLRAGGIFRDVRANELPDIIERVVSALPGASPSVRKLLVERLGAHGGVTIAPIGGGFALPHPATRISLGRDSGTLALICLRDPLRLTEPALDSVPVTRLFFFIAPSPRAHLDLLGRLGRLLTRGPVRELILGNASDEAIFEAVADSDAAAGMSPSEGGP